MGSRYLDNPAVLQKNDRRVTNLLRRLSLNKSLSPLSVGLWIVGAEYGFMPCHGVEDCGLEFVAINPSEAPEGVKRKERKGARWATENSFRITRVEVVTHHPEQKIFGQGFILWRHFYESRSVCFS